MTSTHRPLPVPDESLAAVETVHYRLESEALDLAAAVHAIARPVVAAELRRIADELGDRDTISEGFASDLRARAAELEP